MQKNLELTDRMEEVCDRLKQARIDAGFETAGIAASALGLSYGTYAAHENGTRGVPAKRLEQYARKFKVSIEWLLTGKKTSGTTAQPLAISGSIPVVGFVAAGTWLEVDAPADEISEYVPYMPSLPFPTDYYFALVVRGKSMNRTFQDGAKLVCLDVAKSGIDIRDGDIAIVERQRAQGSLREVTAKRVRKSRGRLELWPESTEPQHQNPVILNSHTSEDETINLIARVVGVYSEL